MENEFEQIMIKTLCSFFLRIQFVYTCLVMGLLLVSAISEAQVFFTNAAPSVTINFSNTIPTSVGSNPSTAFSGTGFEPNTITAGRLNSNAWSVTGWNDGNLSFGGTQITAATDYTRGSVAAAVTIGGIYAFTGATHSAVNPCLMLQPGGGDFAPGTITLRMVNNGTSPITSLTVSYNLYVRNDQGRRNSFNFSYSVDDAVYTSVAALDYISTEVADGLGWVIIGSAPSRSTNITGLNIAPGSSIYIRWSSADVAGSGSRDEFGLDDIALTASYTTLPTNILSDPGVNWVGSNQTPTAYAQPINCSGTLPYVLKYRRITTTLNNPIDGRGQWTTTLNAQAIGADVSTTNLTGGTNNGFLFTSGGSCGTAGTYANKWVFANPGSAALNVINGNNWYNSPTGLDMGLNMSTAGYYTFVLRDAGYANSNFYVGYTAAPPVSISHTTATQITLNGDYSLTVQATLSATPSAQENFYVRYRVGTNDFTTGTSLTAAGTVSGSTVTFTIPTQTVGATVYYYIFSTTVANGTLTGYIESDKSLAALRVADNSNTNFAYTIPASTTYTWAGGATGAWNVNSSWSPNTGFPGNGDAVIFDNSTSVIVTAVPSVNLRSVSMTGAGAVTWQASGSRTVNVGFSGAANPVFNLAGGKQLNFSESLSPIVLNIKSGFTATIAGTVVFSGPSGSVDHRLTGEAANAITFQSGSRFEAGNFFGGNPFGNSGVSNTVIFASGSIYDYYAGSNPFGLASPNSKVVFQLGSLYRHNTTSFPSFSGRTYSNVQIMSGAGTTLNNLTGSNGYFINNLVLESGVTLGLNLSGSHTISGNITVANGATLSFGPSSAGTVNFNGSTDQFITVNGTGSITTGANSTLSVSANSILNFVGESYIGGSGTFVLQPNSSIGIGSADGITIAVTIAGNVRTATRTFISDATYIYNGSSNQVTGTGLPVTINNDLKIANTGVAGSNTVTLTTDNTTVYKLFLNNGYFAAGSVTRNLNISSGGFVYGNGGNNPNNANAGNIVFLGTGYTNGTSSGNPLLYSVIINGAVDFNGNPNTNSATIMSSLQLNSGSSVADAPFYQSGSTLIYNTGGSYNRNVEWGSASGQGYPHHVQVQGNTTLNLNTNNISPAQLAIAGNLTIGNASSWGIVNLNGTMDKALSVGGNLEIGNNNAAANTSALNLSTTNGGDLWLYGNFTRWNGSFYTDNSRAIFFKGTADATINTPNVAITAGVPTQIFSYALLDKSAGTEKITLNCPVGINYLITFTKGIITSTSTNLFVMANGSAVAGTPSDLSFVNGPMKKVGNTAFVFPVGKPLLGGTVGGGYRFIGISAPANSLDHEFTAEFYVANAALRGPVTAAGLVKVSACEYWRLDRNSGISTINVTLSWAARSKCNVGAYVTNPATIVVAHNTATGDPFGSGNWDAYGRDGGNTGDNTAGTVTWNNVSTFSPFALGSINQADNPLPFNLSSFTATPKQNTVAVYWKVANNNEQQEYILERSADATNFRALKNVTAKANIVIADYTYSDEQPFNGWNYYRLRAIDHQNKTQTSSIIKVWMGKGAFISVLPNPATEKIVINLSEPSSILQMQIVNTTGQVLRQLNTIQFLNEINISNLQAGMYYIRFLGKDGVTTKSFIKH